MSDQQKKEFIGHARRLGLDPNTELWLFWQAARAGGERTENHKVLGPIQADALNVMERYKQSFGQLYTHLGQFLDREEGEGDDVNVEEAWADFNRAPGPVYWSKIEALIKTADTHPPAKVPEPDQFWDADNSETNYSDPYELADNAAQDLRKGETMTVDVLCGKELPKRTMRIWVTDADEIEFEWLPAGLKRPKPPTQEGE